MRGTTLGAALLLAMLLVSACARVGAGGTASPATFRAMTYNIAAGGGDLGRIVSVIRTADPDVVALQEVDVHWSDRSAFADQARALADSLRMDVRFAPIYDLPGADASRPRRQYGLALLSRFPVTAFRNHALTRHSTQQPNAPPSPMPGFLDATLDVRGTPVRVFDTHLDYRADPTVRATQTREMLAIIGRTDAPVVLMGDLNAARDAAELAPLFTVLRDAWPGDAGPGFTYPATAPVKRIDFVLHSPALRSLRARVAEGGASDHRAVVVDLVLGAMGRN